MALLSCLRKHRTLLGYRHQRAFLRRQAFARKQQASAASHARLLSAAAPLTMAPPLTTVPRNAPQLQDDSATSKPIHVPAPVVPVPVPVPQVASAPDAASRMESEIGIPLTTAASTSPLVDRESESETRVVEPTNAPKTVSTSPWRSLFLTFFAMLQSDPEQSQRATGLLQREQETDMDELSVISVPPRISDVLHPAKKLVDDTDDDTDTAPLFWRYDMESYAANRRNEDRSQYIMDSIERHALANVTKTTSSVFFCGCYDGHGGEEAVEFVRQRLYTNIKRELVSSDRSVSDAIVQGFQQTDDEFHRHSVHKFSKGFWSSCSVGACAVIALIVDGKLYVAGCGDCRAIMAFRKSDGSLAVEQITLDHSANEVREQQRLRQMHPNECDIVRQVGLDSFYVKGRLQPTRSLGDTYMKVADVNRAPMPRGLRIQGLFERPYISATPDVFEVDLANRHPEFLVLGSDGLYGELTNDEIAELVATYRAEGSENVSKAVLSSVLHHIADDFGFSREELEGIAPGERRNYHDDITIDIVHFSPPNVLSSSSASSCCSTIEPEAEEVMLEAA